MLVQPNDSTLGFIWQCFVVLLRRNYYVRIRYIWIRPYLCCTWSVHLFVYVGCTWIVRECPDVELHGPWIIISHYLERSKDGHSRNFLCMLAFFIVCVYLHFFHHPFASGHQRRMVRWWKHCFCCCTCCCGYRLVILIMPSPPRPHLSNHQFIYLFIDIKDLFITAYLCLI